MRKRTRIKPQRSVEEVGRLIEQNMKLAWYFVGKYKNWHPDDHERLSFALNGLQQAAENWDAASGIPFGSYASLRIKWLFLRINQKGSRIKRGGGKVVAVSLDEELDSSPLASIIPDPNAKMPYGEMMLSETAVKVHDLIFKLEGQERTVIERRFGTSNDPETLEQIASDMNVSRERVRQIEEKALARLRCLHNGEPFRWDSKRRVDQMGRRPGSSYSAKERKSPKRPQPKLKRKPAIHKVCSDWRKGFDYGGWQERISTTPKRFATQRQLGFSCRN